MRKGLLLLACLLVAGICAAQDTVSPAGGASAEGEAFLETGRAENVSLAWGLGNFSYVDGRLSGSRGGIMLLERESDGRIVAMEPDTLFGRMKDEVVYAVRNPRDGLLYFVAGSKGERRLYTLSPAKGGKGSRVAFHRWSGAVEHPVFSENGNLMVFSSDADGGRGGADLWGSFWNGKQWGRPFNLGSVINTAGDEKSPAFYQDFLIFSSNGRTAGAEGDSLFSVKLPATMGENEIPLVPFNVQPLPEPFNGGGSNSDMAVDAGRNRGCWISTRDGKPRMYCFKGSLSFVRLVGRVTDQNDNSIAGAKVTLMAEDGPLLVGQTNAGGYYSVPLQPGRDYTVAIEKHGFFKYRRRLHTIGTGDGELGQTIRHDVCMKGMPLNRMLRYSHLFRQGGDIELSVKGKADIMKVANFLRDNPKVRLEVSLLCDAAKDREFNILLTEKRISFLRLLFESQLPSDTQISYKNATQESELKPTGSGVSELLLILADK